MCTFTSISIELTKRCNLNCQYCYAGANSKAYSDIDYKQLSLFFKDFKKSGGQKVLLTGGEIFLHNHVTEIIQNAYEAGLIVDLFTNGTLIQDEQVSLIQKYIHQVFISLDGPQETHDRLSCVQGSYARTVCSINELSKSGVAINLQSMIVPENKDHNEWLLELLRNYEIKTVVLSHVSRVGKGREAVDLLLGDSQMLSLLDLSADLVERCQYKTRIVTNIITDEMRMAFYNDFTHILAPWMMPNGDIYLCYNTQSDYWKYTDYTRYPSFRQDAYEKYWDLNARLLESTKNRAYFDLFYVIDEVSTEIIKEKVHL